MSGECKCIKNAIFYKRNVDITWFWPVHKTLKLKIDWTKNLKNITNLTSKCFLQFPNGFFHRTQKIVLSKLIPLNWIIADAKTFTIQLKSSVMLFERTSTESFHNLFSRPAFRKFVKRFDLQKADRNEEIIQAVFGTPFGALELPIYLIKIAFFSLLILRKSSRLEMDGLVGGRKPSGHNEY